MIDQLALPSDLVPYLVWLSGSIGESWTQTDRALNWPIGPEGTLSVDEARLAIEWNLMVERLQVAAALVAGEARRRGFDDIAAPHDLSPWVVPRAWPERGREMMSASDTAYRGAPAFPADPAFAASAPASRDRAGAETVHASAHFSTTNSIQFGGF